MASQAPSTSDAFNQRVNDFQCPKQLINSIVLDYLTKEGYAEAAQRFCREANVNPLQDFSRTESRQRIIHLILLGKIEEAIQTINDFDYEILDNNPELHFNLLRLHLIDLIGECYKKDNDPLQFLPVVEFAQTHMTSRALRDVHLLHSLERVMALIVYPPSETELPDLYDPTERWKVAEDVNTMMLRSQSMSETPALGNLLSMDRWLKGMAAFAGVNLPSNLTEKPS